MRLAVAAPASKVAWAGATLLLLGVGSVAGLLFIGGQATNKPRPDFTISGAPPRGALLLPGGRAVPINLRFTNRSRFRLTVRRVRVVVMGTSARGCRASNFVVVQHLRARAVVPPHATRSLASLGLRRWNWPRLRMRNGGNQDACQRAKVELRFTGRATR